ncbi:NADP-dependent oxidoreductase [Tardiphaga sp.]|jgi:NADPH-dependent curcumin reductase CurA|uniref:NADP-dependent oxidoreductase n=1 Tax=Tardiphaga sp. TaxID=1926292 RepID=UPI0037DA317E
MNRQIVLARRPVGEPQSSDFAMQERGIPAVDDGHVLLKTELLSLDPYMRWRMNEGPSYAPPVALGGVMVGSTVSRVVTSRHPEFREDDLVVGRSGWQEFALSDGTDLRRIANTQLPPSAALGILGSPGLTAYTGLLNIGQPKAGETLVVAAATGPVGALVGQIARLKGCRVVAIAGGLKKCRYAVDVLGFDAAIDHRDPDMAAKLRSACSNGIDIYFENVGGLVWDAVFPLLNDFARIPVCGLISQYNDAGAGQSNRLAQAELMRTALVKRLTIRGFIVTDFIAQMDDFQRDVGGWLAEGKLVHREQFVDGLENAPQAFIGMLKGQNFGKLIVRVAGSAA